MTVDEPEALLRQHVDPLAPYIGALQRWKQWRDNVPLFYTTCVQSVVDVPSTTVQLFPHLWRIDAAPGLLHHAVLYGTVVDDVSCVELSCFFVDDPAADRGQLSQASVDLVMPTITVGAFRHPAGDVDRLRYCPSRPELVAVKCTGAALTLYNITPGLELLDAKRKMLVDQDGRGDDAAAEGEGTAVAAAGEVGGWDAGSTLASERQDGVALAWGGSPGGAAGSDLRLYSGMLNGSIGEYAVREDGSLAEVTVRRGGHEGDADIHELAWSCAEAGGSGVEPDASAAAGCSGTAGAAAAPSGLLASAASDGRTLLWDPRQRLAALRLPRCHEGVNGVAFAPPAGGAGAASAVVAAAGDDGVVRVYDIRQLRGGACAGGGVEERAAAGTNGGRGGVAGVNSTGAAAAVAAPPPPLHRLKGHACEVRQLAFSPHSAALLASADEQGRVVVWDLGRSAPLPEGLQTRPELVFCHAGHVLPVDDFSWSTELYGTLASVSGYLDPDVVAAVRGHPEGGLELEGQMPAVQVWRPMADLLPAPSGDASRPRLRLEGQ